MVDSNGSRQEVGSSKLQQPRTSLQTAARSKRQHYGVGGVNATNKANAGFGTLKKKLVTSDPRMISEYVLVSGAWRGDLCDAYK